METSKKETSSSAKPKHPPTVTYLPTLPPALPTCPPPNPECSSQVACRFQGGSSRIQCPRFEFPKIECPKLEFPMIECPKLEICPPSMCCTLDCVNADTVKGRGSYASCDTVERESNTISFTDSNGKTTILCSEGSERQATVMNRKDAKGMSHSYCKEVEKKSRRAACDKQIKTGKSTCDCCPPKSKTKSTTADVKRAEASPVDDGVPKSPKRFQTKWI